MSAEAGLFLWQIPPAQTPGSDYTVKITSLSDPSTEDSSDGVFAIEDGPNITISSPGSSISWKAGTEHTISWSAVNITDNVKIELFKDNVLQTVLESSVPSGDGQFAWGIPETQEPADNYQIKITDLANSLVYDYSDYFTISDVNEPNNDENDAKPLAFSSSTKGRINPAGDADWFYVDVGGEGELLVSVTEAPSDLSYLVYLSDGNGNVVSSTYGSGESAHLTYTAGAGRYYIEVVGNGNSYSTGSYTVEAAFTPVSDAYESNDDINEAKELSLNTPTSGRIYPSGDEDWFWLDVTGEEGELSVSVTGVPSDLSYYVYLWDGNGNVVSSGYGNGGAASLQYTAVAGRYYVEVYGNGNSYSLGSYTLTAVTSPGSGTDPHEPNDVFGEATVVGLGVPEVSYLSGSEHDWYHVSAGGRGMLHFSVTSLAATMSPMLRVYNGSQELLEEHSGSGVLTASLSVETGGSITLRCMTRGATGQGRRMGCWRSLRMMMPMSRMGRLTLRPW